MRSMGCRRARVSEARSLTSWRSPNCSISTARKGISALRSLREIRSRSARPNEEGNAILAMLARRCFDGGQMFLDDADHLPGFRIFGGASFLGLWPGGTKKRPHFDARVAARRWRLRGRRSEGHLVFLPGSGPEDLAEDIVQAVHQACVRAEVGLQLQRLQFYGCRSFSQPVPPCAFEELHLGLAEHVN